MINFVKTTNGETYQVMRRYEDKYGCILLLASYSGRYPSEEDDENNITQYIIAIGCKSWAYGHYFPVWNYGNEWAKAYKAAFDDFKAQIRF